MRRYYAEAHLDDEHRTAPMPPEARTLSIAERFHTPPWLVEQAPADDVLRWIAVMSIEGEMRAASAGLGRDERLYIEDEDDEWADAV